MANSWFKCKQFTVYHDRCSHKVGTDSILLGSWVRTENAKKILDIGAGCGILSLMMAQRNNESLIYGIEIDKDSYEQAVENINNSNWKDRICLINTSLQEFNSYNCKYDLIITNPPYFVKSLHSPNKKRNQARHAQTLTLSEIINYCSSHLELNGKLALIIPIGNFQYLKDILAIQSMYIHRFAKVFPNYEKEAHRVLIECGKQKAGFEYEEITIETNQRHVYTRQYAELTKDFYLNLNVEAII